MICPKCTRSPEDYVTGEWVHKIINGHLRMVCNICGYIDERKVWIDDVYHGSPDKMLKNPGVK